MYRSHTSSLLWATTNGGHLYALIVNLPVLCNLQLNVLNDLAKAKRRWTEKKRTQKILSYGTHLRERKETKN